MASDQLNCKILLWALAVLSMDEWTSVFLHARSLALEVSLPFSDVCKPGTVVFMEQEFHKINTHAS